MTSENVMQIIRLHEGNSIAHPNKADLDPETGKVVAGQLPLLDYAASKHAAAHAATGSDPITPADSGAAPKSHTHTTKDLPATMPPSAHKHTKSDISDFPASMPASDVFSWAKAASKPKYTPSEVGAAPASHSHGSADLPIMPISKGGTGANTAAAALYALLNGSGALAASGIAMGDILALGDISAKTGKKVTLADLMGWMKNNGSVQIATGSYVETGTYGVNNPCSLTFPFVPKLVSLGCVSSVSTSAQSARAWVNRTAGETTGVINNNKEPERVTITWNGKTVSWWSNTSANHQLNNSTLTYCYVVIG